MLLETLDIKHNDVVIYSQNLFDMEKNFKIINKDDPNKEHRKINYGEVCRIINEFTPKNLIVYRLLTNVKNFEINLSKYGFMLNINDVSEIIYFDPIFAVKDLEDYPNKINFNELRFRIQQVGLTTLNRKGNLPNYAEIYNIDLEAIEAKFQNDKVFADAIFSIETRVKAEKNNFGVKVSERKKQIQGKSIIKKENFSQKISSKSISNENSDSKDIPDNQKKSLSKPFNQNLMIGDEKHIDGIKIIKHEISEDKDFDYKQIMKINFRGASGFSSKKVIQDSLNDESLSRKASSKLKKTEESSFGKFLKQKLNESNDLKSNKSTNETHVSPLIDIFKSPTPLNHLIKERENKQVILRLDKK